MFLTPENPAYNNAFAAVPKAVEAFQSLSIDDKLGLLWGLHKHMGALIHTGDLVASSSAGTAEPVRLAGSLDYEVASLAHKEQLRVLRDLVWGVNTPVTLDYEMLSTSNKLAFWRQLAEWMQSGEVIPVPEDYELSAQAAAALNKIVALESRQQVAVLCLIVGKMRADRWRFR